MDKRHRLANVRALIQKHGRETVAAKMECSAAYVSQIAGVNPVRPITENTARAIEKAFRLPRFALDKEAT